MIILIILILCNVLLAIIFKYFDKYKVDNLHAIIINYVTAVVVAGIVLQQSPIPGDLLSKPWFPYSLLLSLLFITGFNIMAHSFQKAGVAITAIVSKMSLVISAGFAIAYYSETLNLPKGIGILAALIAIVLVNLPSKKDGLNLSENKYLWLPIVTMLMSGIIEIILMMVEVEGKLGDDGILFTSSSFAMAGVFGLVFAVFKMITAGARFSKQDIIGGVILGVPNFFTIYLLIYLLTQGWEGSVLFPINSVGMLALTVVVSVLMFGEKVDLKKGLGLLFSIIAIVLISAS